MPHETTDYFSGLAETYDTFRPGYPTQAIESIFSDVSSSPVVADVGCGTGISTRLLAPHAALTYGIDPNDDMLTAARQHGDQINYQSGTGEQTGLPNHSVDIVVCAQSFHWVIQRDALKEFHRILRLGGRLALMWNVKDDSDPFTSIFSNNAKRAQTDAITRGMTVYPDRGVDLEANDFFTNIRMNTFANPQPVNLDGLLGRARSASYFPRSGTVRDSLENELRDAYGTYQQNGSVTILYRTELTLADRIDP